MRDDEHDRDAVSAAYAACRKRLYILASLEQGWLGEGEGDQITDAARARAEGWLNDLFSVATAPLVFPTPTGGVQLEWHGSRVAFDLEIDADGVTSAGWADLASDDFGLILEPQIEVVSDLARGLIPDA